MRNLIKRLARSEDKLDDFLTLCTSGLMTRGKLLRSRKVYYKNQGRIKIDRRLFLGFLSNRIGMDPGSRGVFRIYKNGKFHAKGFVRIARTARIFVAGSLEIGDRSYVNPGTLVFARTNVRIGTGCAISWNCEIVDDDFHKIHPNDHSSRPISIGNDVWIGSNSTILKGVTIGNGSIIGSRSVVTRDIPDNCLAVGAPAKVIRTDVRWQ